MLCTPAFSPILFTSNTNSPVCFETPDNCLYGNSLCVSLGQGFFYQLFAMKILAWNVQGAKKQLIGEEIRYLQKFQQPDLIFLIETMASEETTHRILPHLGFDCYDYTLPVNHSGGIWVLWSKRNILANVLLKEDRAIHMLVFDTIS